MPRSSRPAAAAQSRYEILRQLGEGASGKVFLATDRETGEQVALKRLTRVDAKTVLRLKREFRSLADLRHPNLVKLYDLLRDQGDWLLVMEYVAGPSLDVALAQARAADPGARLGRIVAMFQQLALGVEALHRAGVLHRDLKPRNVLASDARIVIVDFGLMRELDAASPLITQDRGLTGTPAYMAPEQAAAQALSDAADWYAFGTMLYEALSGRLPIAGDNAVQLLANKAGGDAAPLAPELDVPASLRALCMGLLRRDPGARPGASEVVATLRALDTSHASVEWPAGRARPAEWQTGRARLAERQTGRARLAERQSGRARPAERQAARAQPAEWQAGRARPAERQTPERAPLVGRDAQLAQLQAALERARDGSRVAHVRGSSGMGKSALLEQFVSQAGQAASPGRELLILRGRCYERETIPFKALDAVIEALVRHLASIDEFEAAHVLPTEIAELAQLFPVFERLDVVRRLLTNGRPRGEASQIRQRAERGLRGLLARLGHRSLPVIIIDDLQWGDLDSARVLRDWLRAPIGPLLLVFCYRRDEVDTSACLRELAFGAAAPPSTAAGEVVIDLEPLCAADVERLCQLHAASISEAVREHIVDEAQGNPFLALQLCAFARAKLEQGERAPSSLSLGALVNHASDLMPPAARRLLEVLAVAGRPLPPRFALTAAGDLRDGRSLIDVLHGLHLVRLREVKGERWLEVYHDRVREAVQRALSVEERARVHAALLREAKRDAHGDPDWLHMLALGAAERADALLYGRIAAARASSSLAFEHAVELYACCVELCDEPQLRSELCVALATCLAHNRRGLEAAHAYLQAASGADAAQSIELLRLAASHFLRSGRFEEGDALLWQVVEARELNVPRTRSGLMAAIAWERTRLALRTREFEARPATDATRELAREAELYGTLAVETLYYAPLRAALFQARGLRLALEAGEPVLYTRMLCLTATLRSFSSTRSATREAEATLAQAAELTARYGGRRLQLELLSARTVSALVSGRPRDVLEPASAAEALCETQSAAGDPGEYYYMFAVRTSRISALQNLAQYVAADQALDAALEAARLTDNRAATWLLALSMTLSEQMKDQCAHSHVRLLEQRKQLPEGEFGMVRLQHLLAVLRAAAMARDPAWAWPIIEQDWPRYLRAPIYRGAYTAYVAHVAHARLLLNGYARERRGDPAQLVRADLRALGRQPPSAFRAASMQRIRARLAYFRGDVSRACAALRESMRGFAEAGCTDDSERDRYALGLLLGGEEGAEHIALSSARSREIGCSDPARDIVGYYPELVPA